MSSNCILITGPESSGKSTLARNLAWALDGIYRPEFAREYLTQRRGKYTAADLPLMLSKQSAQDAELRLQHPSATIFCDTGPFVFYVWNEVKYGSAQAALTRAMQTADFDLAILCYPDLDWEPDPLRENPDQNERKRLFQRYEELLRERQQAYVVIKGQHRTEQAIAALQCAK